MTTTHRTELRPKNGPVVVTPKPGVTATLAEYEAAKAAWLRIERDSWWNPWRREDDADRLAAAESVMNQFQSSGVATNEEIQAWQAEMDAQNWAKATRHRDRHATEPNALFLGT